VDQSQLIQLLAIALAAGAIFVLFSGESKDTTSKKRLAEVSGIEKEGTFSFLKKEENTSSRRKQIEESLGQMEQAQKDKSKQRKSLKSRLIQANVSITPQTYIIISIVFGLIVAGAVFVAMGNPLIAVGAGLAVGYVIPRFVLGFLIARRQKNFIGGFPDAMDIIVRGVRSGLPLGDCLKVIAHESPDPIGAEFKLVVQGEQVGVPIEVCLERLYERMPLAEVNFFATVLAIQKQSGGNLGEALGNLSGVLRGRKLLREKIKALSAEAKMSATIVGALPPLVMILVTLVQPDYMWELYHTPTGHRNLAVGAGMMVVGTLFMRKLINFKI